MLFEFGLTIQF